MYSISRRQEKESIMKSSNFIISLVATSLSIGLLVGCGGGGGSSDGTPTAQLSPTNVNKFVKSVSDEVGCTYTQSQNAAQLRSVDSYFPIKTVVMELSTALKDRGIYSSNLRVALRESKVVQGACGGTMTLNSSADEKSGSYIFNNYCSTTDNGTRSTIDGKLDLSTSSSGSAMTINFSTPTPLHVVSQNPNTGKNVDVVLNVANGKFYSSDGLTDATSSKGTKTLSIGSVSIKDNASHESYSFRNVSVNMNGSSTTFTASYADPDLGVVTISSSSGDLNSKNGTITISGAGGNKALITSGTTEGVFNVTSGGSRLGTMDCSTVSTTL